MGRPGLTPVQIISAPQEFQSTESGETQTHTETSILHQWQVLRQLCLITSKGDTCWTILFCAMGSQSLIIHMPQCSDVIVQTVISLEWKVQFQQYRRQFTAYKLFFLKRHQNIHFDFLTQVPPFDMMDRNWW